MANILITAGPTREPLDPVRFLSNRSSGKMGYAIAQAAQEAGHSVLLVSGPVSLPVPADVELVKIETAQQMYDTVAQHIPHQDIAIFCAAVADYRPIHFSNQKIKKATDRLTIELERTPDILGSARAKFGFAGYLVGFAAETTQVAAYAADKLERKGCDLIVANDVSQPGIGFDADDNAVTLFHKSGSQEAWPRASKLAIARRLIELIALNQQSRNQGSKA